MTAMTTRMTTTMTTGTTTDDRRMYFVYYKIGPEQRAAACALVKTFHAAVTHRFPAIDCELMQRPESSAEGIETWMEIYRSVAGLPETTIQAIDALALAVGMPAPRRGELFIPLDLSL